MAFDSLFIGVSGLDAFQQQIDVISNNLANVGTTGFKSQNVNFEDLLYQAQSYPTAPTTTNGGIDGQNVGLGVKVGSIDTDFSEGTLETTGVNTNLALNGDGFFVLNNTQGTGTPTYTRNGDFELNSNGVLYDPSSGLAVMGYTANAAGVVTASNTPGAIQIPLGLTSAAVATGAGAKTGPTGDQVFDVAYGGNLDQTNYATAASNGAVAASQITTISTTIYDSLGNAHLVDVTFQPEISVVGGAYPTNGMGLPSTVSNAAGAQVTAATEWSYTITSTDGTLFNDGSGTTSTSTTPQYVFFDQNGQFINTSGTPIPPTPTAPATPTDVHLSGADPSATDGNQLSVAQWGTGTGNNSTSTTAPVPAGPIGLSFADMTSLAGNSTADTVSQNGFTTGTLSNLTIGSDGVITGAFSNGENQTLGQVVVARFQNEDGLTQVGSSQFEQSANSGLAQLGTAGTGTLGKIVAGSLEESNVSISGEFTKMIFAQNAYTANSKSITIANQDLQTAVNLIQGG
jgi:flagellar hook protein FlgE